MKAAVVTCVLVLIALLNACGSPVKTHMQQKQLFSLIEAKQAPLIIDVRSQSEYESGHLPGAIHIPFWSAFSPVELEKTDPTTKLVLYCQHGPRAGIAKFALSLSGFENIVYLEGHMSAWQQAKLPVVQEHSVVN